MFQTFQTSVAIVAIVFAFFISDFRKKTGMVPLIKEKWTLILKLSCIVPLIVYAYVLSTLEWISMLDLVAFCLMFLGTLVVAKAKLDLSKHHTWAGYCLRSSKLFTKGIYAYIRHPIYTGVYLFVFGLILTIAPHADWYLTLASSGALVYILAFLAYSATRESESLSRKLGPVFLSYKNQVHFCLPLRRYIETPN